MFSGPWSDGQRVLAEELYRQWSVSSTARWPSYDYVEHAMARQGHDVQQVLDSFPVLGRPGINSLYYSEIAYDRLTGPAGDSQVALTIAGLAKVDPGSGYPRIFMHLLQVAGAARRDATFDPQGVTRVTLNNEEFLREAVGLDSWPLGALAGAVRLEPHFVTGLSVPSEDPASGAWVLEIGRQATRFADGITLPGYLELIENELAPASGPDRGALADLADQLEQMRTVLDGEHDLDLATEMFLRQQIDVLARAVDDLRYHRADVGALRAAVYQVLGYSVASHDVVQTARDQHPRTLRKFGSMLLTALTIVGGVSEAAALAPNTRDTIGIVFGGDEAGQPPAPLQLPAPASPTRPGAPAPVVVTVDGQGHAVPGGPSRLR